MNIDNYSFNCKQVGQFTYQLLIRDELNKVSYGTILQCQSGQPDNNTIFEIFKNKDNFKHFWIELDIIKENLDTKKDETSDGIIGKIYSEPVGDGCPGTDSIPSPG
jgi:hypothetical protein